MKRIVLFLLFLSGFSSSFAQSGDPVKLKDVTKILYKFDWESNYTLQLDLMKKVGMGTMKTIKLYSVPDNWPAGLKTPEARKVNQKKIADYKLFKIFDGEEYTVVEAPQLENTHMPVNLRPMGSIYFILPPGETMDVPKPEPVTYTDRAWLTKPEKLLTNFDLSKDPSAVATAGGDTTGFFRKRPQLLGLISKYGQESNWPAGINTAEKRKAKADQLKKYRGYPVVMLIIKEAMYEVIWVPKEENLKLPADLQPKDANGFFFIVDMGSYDFESAEVPKKMPVTHLAKN